MLAMTLLSPALTLGASVPYNLESNLNSGISPDPNEHKSVGYITAFVMANPKSNVTFSQDLKVYTPYQGPPLNYGGMVASMPGSPAPGSKAAPMGTAQVVGIIEKFQWAGGVGDPIQIEFYVSQENAVKLKALQQQTLTSTKVSQLGWWIADYDQETKKWYEKAYPQSSRVITGIIAPPQNPQLDVNLAPVMAKNVPMYKVTMKVAPTPNMPYTLFFANSSTKPASKPWGLKVGNLAPTLH
jgi:hypothetical protein